MCCPNDPHLLSKHIILFYRRTTGIEVNDVIDIPPDSLSIILNMRYVDIIADAVREDKAKNLSLRFLAMRYGVGVRVIRTIVSH
jgi:hypothetical protein